MCRSRLSSNSVVKFMMRLYDYRCATADMNVLSLSRISKSHYNLVIERKISKCHCQHNQKVASTISFHSSLPFSKFNSGKSRVFVLFVNRKPKGCSKRTCLSYRLYVVAFVFTFTKNSFCFYGRRFYLQLQEMHNQSFPFNNISTNQSV